MNARAPTDPATVFAWSATRFAPVASLFALDAQLGTIVRTTTQPIIGQMRLTWWHDALEGLGDGPVPAHPVLQGLAALPAAAALTPMIDGWEVLLEDESPDDAALARLAGARGGTLFAAAAQVLGGEGAAQAAGEGWALADVAAHVGDAALAARATALALPRLDAAVRARWRGPAAALGALAAEARAALRGRGAAGGPQRAGAVLRWRLIGR